MAENSEKRKKQALWWKGWFWAAILLTITMLYAYFLFPLYNLGPRQPIFFSHRVHAGVKQINCRFCHSYVERSEHAGLPTVEKCFYCHKYVIPMHPQISLEKEHLDKKIPVPWVRVFFVPDFVKFRHEPHIKFGKLDCTRCHGEVQASDRLQKVDFQMNFCIDCHKERKAQLDCYMGCHH